MLQLSYTVLPPQARAFRIACQVVENATATPHYTVMDRYEGMLSPTLVIKFGCWRSLVGKEGLLKIDNAHEDGYEVRHYLFAFTHTKYPDQVTVVDLFFSVGVSVEAYETPIYAVVRLGDRTRFQLTKADDSDDFITRGGEVIAVVDKFTSGGAPVGFKAPEK